MDARGGSRQQQQRAGRRGRRQEAKAEDKKAVHRRRVDVSEVINNGIRVMNILKRFPIGISVKNGSASPTAQPASVSICFAAPPRLLSNSTTPSTTFASGAGILIIQTTPGRKLSTFFQMRQEFKCLTAKSLRERPFVSVMNLTEEFIRSRKPEEGARCLFITMQGFRICVLLQRTNYVW